MTNETFSLRVRLGFFRITITINSFFLLQEIYYFSDCLCRACVRV